MRTSNPRVGVTTREFVDRWLDAVVSGDAVRAADDQTLRTVVRTRELQQKRAQARLGNGKLLATWSGEAGTARLDFRWATVRRLVADIQEGLTGAGA